MAGLDREQLLADIAPVVERAGTRLLWKLYSALALGVVALLGLLVIELMDRRDRGEEQQKTIAARAELTAIRDKLVVYHTQTGHYPKPDALGDAGVVLGRDPWGKTYVYKLVSGRPTLLCSRPVDLQPMP
jgi:hypothetical protein